MMPMPPASDDVSSQQLRNDVIRFAHNDAMFAFMCRRHTSLPQVTSCAQHASFARQGKHHSKKRDLINKSRFFAGGDVGI